MFTLPEYLIATSALDLRGVEETELVIGLVGALGSPMKKMVSVICEQLWEMGYEAAEVRLSSFLAAYDLDTPHPADDDPPEVRWHALMDRGDQFRTQLECGDALAMHAAAHLHLEM